MLCNGIKFATVLQDVMSQIYEVIQSDDTLHLQSALEWLLIGLKNNIHLLNIILPFFCPEMLSAFYSYSK